MPTFSYEAKDGDGRTVSGLIEAGRAARRRRRAPGTGAVGDAHRAAGAAAAGTAVAPAAAAATRVGAQTRTDIAPFLVSVPLPTLAMTYRQFATLNGRGRTDRAGNGAPWRSRRRTRG
jgi:hypothetical protein